MPDRTDNSTGRAASQESACAASATPRPIATVRNYDDLRRAVAAIGAAKSA
jgi:hypothetical protein